MVKHYPLKMRLLILLSLMLSVFLIQTSLAKEESLPVLKTKAKTIAVFKNGLGFFIRDGEILLNSQKAC